MARKRPGSFCPRPAPLPPPKKKKAGSRLHLNTHTLLTQRSRSGLTMPLSRHNEGAYPEMNSHATCQGTVSHSRLSLLSHCGWSWRKEWNRCAQPNLYFKKKKKKAQAGNELSNVPESPRTREKATTTTFTFFVVVHFKFTGFTPDISLSTFSEIDRYIGTSPLPPFFFSSSSPFRLFPLLLLLCEA